MGKLERTRANKRRWWNENRGKNATSRPRASDASQPVAAPNPQNERITEILNALERHQLNKYIERAKAGGELTAAELRMMETIRERLETSAAPAPDAPLPPPPELEAEIGEDFNVITAAREHLPKLFGILKKAAAEASAVSERVEARRLLVQLAHIETMKLPRENLPRLTLVDFTPEHLAKSDAV